MRNRMFWVVATLGLGLLQAWDSNAFEAEPATIALVIAAVALGTTAISRPGRVVQIAALVLGALLLAAARATSQVPLGGLHLALFPSAVYVLFSSAREASLTSAAQPPRS
jgi:uncharacterized membrane protein (UPF0136 family)